MKSLWVTCLFLFSLFIELKAQHTINYLATSNGAVIPSGGGTHDYFGPSGVEYGVMGTCGAGGYDWIDALCGSTSNFSTISKKIFYQVSTWGAGGGANTGYMVVDLGQVRTFNELRVFQTYADGKVTHVKMYVHPDTSGVAPIYSDGDWTVLIPESLVGAGAFSGDTVSKPTVISFADQTARFVKFEFRNDGSFGFPNWIELRELKLFYNEPGFSPNYLSTFLSGATIPTHPDSLYFGPSGVEFGGTMGTCGVGDRDWIHALCDQAPNAIRSSEKTSPIQGSTWHAGGGANTGYMIVDLGQVRTFNELGVYQMHGVGVDGKVTHARMYTHPDTTGSTPFAGDEDWVPAFNEMPVGAGVLSGNFVNSPTIIDFPDQTARFVKLAFRNDGTHGNPTYIGVRSVKLYHKTSPPLPVELIAFEATPFLEQHLVELRWSTATEINNDYFEIERSSDGISFSSIGKIKGGGNSNVVLAYMYIDDAPLMGVSYYRIKQTDYDGTYKFTGIRAVRFNNESDFLVYPNPVNDYLTVRLGNVNAPVSIIIQNMQGQEVYQENYTEKTIKREIDFSGYPKGMYVLKISGDQNQHAYRVIKL